MARKNGAKRAVSFTELENTKFKELAFDGEWKEAMGCPELSGTILVYGPPKNGKTYFSLLFAKYLTRFERVAFDALEMGTGAALKQAGERIGFNEHERKRIILLDREPIGELSKRLAKPKAPKIVIIDSLQYTGLNYRQYIEFKEANRGKLLIFISHADGRQPRGEVARSVQYDADVIIRVEGFKAFPASRYGGGGDITVWREGADKYNW